MDGPSFTWPAHLGLPSQQSSTSKQKRVALLFLSGIRASQLLATAPSVPIEELAPAAVKIDPAIMPSGARMKGDAHAKYIRATMEQFDSSLPHRVFLSWERSYPSVVFSVLPNKRRSRLPVLAALHDSIVPEFGKSHAAVFNPALEPRRTHGKRKERTDWDHLYSPDSVDDPRMLLGRHRVVQNVPGMRLSVLPYTKLRVLKDELNQTFREQHMDLPADLTLSMIRSVKRKLLVVAAAADTEMSTVALSFVFFEKLVLKAVVNKRNRRLVAAACALLALKLNDAPVKIKPLLAAVEATMGVGPTDVTGAEFAVFAQLNFHLMVPTRHYLGHFVRILKENDGAAGSHFAGENLDQTLEDLAELAREDSREDDSSESSSEDGAAASVSTEREPELVL